MVAGMTREELVSGLGGVGEKELAGAVVKEFRTDMCAFPPSRHLVRRRMMTGSVEQLTLTPGAETP
jgi:hypothetical protein